jgi:hypothetical protein
MLLAFVAATGSERLLNRVTRDDCTVFLRTVKERGSKPNTIKAYHRALDAFFNGTLEDERLESSPMKADTLVPFISIVGKGGEPRTVFYGEAVAGHLRD